MSRLTDTEMWQQLSAEYTRRIPLTRKEKLRDFPIVLMHPPLVLFLAFLFRLENNTSLQPIVITLAVGAAWILLSMISHQAISKEQFNNLSQEEQQRRLLYDSIWHYLGRTGLGFYSVIALTWGIIEIGIAKEQIEVAVILLMIDLILAVVLVFNWRWIRMVKVEGYKKHKTAGTVVRVVFGLFAALLVLPGITSVIRVTTSAETKNLLVVPFMILFNVFPIAIFVMTLLGTLITIAHIYQYRKWEQVS